MTEEMTAFDQVTIKVSMSTKELFLYMMANTTFGIAGKIKWTASLMALVLFPFSLFTDNSMLSLALFIMVAMYLIIQPALLYASAKKQMIENPIFKEEMIYTFDETGMALNQTIDSGMMPWEDIWMVREIASSYLVYLQPGRALVVPKTFMSVEEMVHFRNVIKKNALKYKLKRK